MNEYEQASLWLSFAGQGLVAISILVASKALSLSKEDRQRRKRLDTINYIRSLKSDLKEPLTNINNNVEEFTKTITLVDFLDKNEELMRDVNKVLNSLNDFAKHLDIYDYEKARDYLYSNSTYWMLFEPYISHQRKRKKNLWLDAELIVNKVKSEL